VDRNIWCQKWDSGLKMVGDLDCLSNPGWELNVKLMRRGTLREIYVMM
jgi:hypothetical protein